eukprot:6172273-Pleurochrysis_carterae.AAC.2
MERRAERRGVGAHGWRVRAIDPAPSLAVDSADVETADVEAASDGVMLGGGGSARGALILRRRGGTTMQHTSRKIVSRAGGVREAGRVQGDVRTGRFKDWCRCVDHTPKQGTATQQKG